MDNRVKENRWIDPRFKALSIDKTGSFIKLSDGRLMAVEGNATYITTDHGKSWSEPRTIYDAPGPGVPKKSGEALFRTADGVIILIWIDDVLPDWDSVNVEPGKDNQADVWAIRSLDEGVSWVDRQRIFEGICGHLPSKIIQTKSGRIVAPVQFYMRNPGRNVLCTYSSTDNGVTWKRSNIIDLGGHGHHDGALEPTLVELKDGRLWMLIRTNWDRFWDAYSDDGGLSWRVIRPSNIDASTSPGYLSRLASGRLALLWNRLYPEGQDSYPRRDITDHRYGRQLGEVPAIWHREELSMAFSADEGATWTKPFVVAREKGASLSYAYLFEPEPGLLWIFARMGDLQVSAREADLV